MLLSAAPTHPEKRKRKSTKLIILKDLGMMGGPYFLKLKAHSHTVCLLKQVILQKV